MRVRFNVEPTPASRPRISRWSTYYGKNHQKFVEAMKIATANSNVAPYESEIKACVNFFVPMPRTWSKKKKLEHMGKYANNHKDIDNYCKLLFDCLNGIYYKDDKQIVGLATNKYWSDTGYIDVHLTDDLEYKFEV